MALHYKNFKSAKRIRNKAIILIATLLKTPTQHFRIHIYYHYDNPKNIKVDVSLHGILFIELNFPDFTSPPELYKKLTDEVNTQRLLGTIPTL